MRIAPDPIVLKPIVRSLIVPVQINLVPISPRLINPVLAHRKLIDPVPIVRHQIDPTQIGPRRIDLVLAHQRLIDPVRTGLEFLDLMLIVRNPMIAPRAKTMFDPAMARPQHAAQ